MKKKNNVIFIMAGIFLLCVFAYVNRSFLKNSLLSLIPSKTAKAMEPTPFPEDHLLEAIHNEYLETMKNPKAGNSQYENKAIQRIYERDKDLNEYEGKDFSDEQAGNLQLKIIDYFVSDSMEEASDGKATGEGLNKDAWYYNKAFDDNGNLKPQYSLLTVDMDITNTGDVIHYLSTYQSFLQVYILDDQGEWYYWNQKNLCLRKDGDSFVEMGPNNYVIYDLQNGETKTVRYIFAIPKEVFDTDLHIGVLAAIGPSLMETHNEDAYTMWMLRGIQ